jgi:hypothetical protein
MLNGRLIIETGSDGCPFVIWDFSRDFAWGGPATPPATDISVH